MQTLDPYRLSSRINARLAGLSYDFTEGREVHALSVDGHRTIRFPVSAGGKVQGGSGAWVAKKHRDGSIHEPGLVATLLALADERPATRSVLDIGSLYGYVSLVARSLFDQAEVHAFEANPTSYDALVRNLEANRDAFGDSLHAHLCALSDETADQVPMRVDRMSVDVLDPQSAQAGEGRRIDLWSLDDYSRVHDLSPDLIKLDVEGFQAKIIPGARETIARSRPVILLEFDAPGAANDFGVTNAEVIAPLLHDGYRLVWGKHRFADTEFQVLGLDDLGKEHEVNSLGILIP